MDLPELTFPLSQISAIPALSFASLLATRMRNAACLTPRVFDSRRHDKRGSAFSSPSGRSIKSIFSPVTLSPSADAARGAGDNALMPAVAPLAIRNSLLSMRFGMDVSDVRTSAATQDD